MEKITEFMHSEKNDKAVQAQYSTVQGSTEQHNILAPYHGIALCVELNASRRAQVLDR